MNGARSAALTSDDKYAQTKAGVCVAQTGLLLSQTRF